MPVGGAKLPGTTVRTTWSGFLPADIIAQADDAYPQFKALDAAGRLAPTEEDYGQLFRLQERTFTAAVVEEAKDLLEEAVTVSPAEVRRVLGSTVPVSVAVLQAGDMEIVYLATAP